MKNSTVLRDREKIFNTIFLIIEIIQFQFNNRPSDRVEWGLDLGVEHLTVVLTMFDAQVESLMF